MLVMVPGLRSRRRSLAHLILLLGVVHAVAAPRHASESPELGPIYAKVVGLLDARFLSAGSPVLFEVKHAWQYGNCQLREGSILKGRVVNANVSSKQDRTSRVAVVVDEAECNGPALVPFPLTVVAVLAADPAGMHKSAPPNAQPGLMASGVDATFMQTLSSGMAGRPGPPPPSDAAVFFAHTAARSGDAPERVSVGEVFGLSGLKLSVGAGPEQSSVLFVKGRNVSLQRETEVVLIPSAFLARASAPLAAGPSPTAAASSPASPAPAAAGDVGSAKSIPVRDAPPPKAEPDIAKADTDVEVCAAPACSLAPPEDAAIAQAHGEKSLSLGDLGYAPRAGMELDAFDHEAALAYLGEQQLLVTFNLHKLVDRQSGGDVARMVRAAVLDTSTMRVIRVVDWPVADHKQYLWQAGEGRVLAHVGEELRVYGPDLEMERRIALDGPLAWLRVSPSQKNFALGVIRERHSKEVHAQLAASEEPEEDLEIRVLDAGFQTTMTAIRSSRFLPPTLTDEGEVEADRLENDRWHLVEHTWAGQAHSVASVTSACTPLLSSLAPDLLFVATCGRSAGAKYRVMRRDGSLLLQGALSSKELGEGARGAPQGTAFVVGVAEADRTVAPGGYFFPSDLKTEHFAVYRTADGKRIFAMRVGSPAPTREAYALAPGGGELAVLSEQQISLYRLPAPAR
jgi:hypothetical protein